MTLHVGLDGWGQSSGSLHGRSVVPPGWALAGFAVSPASAIPSAPLHLIRHVGAYRHFGLINDAAVGDGGRTDGLAAGIHSRDDFLSVAAGAEQQLNGERVAPHDFGLALLEEMPGFGGL